MVDCFICAFNEFVLANFDFRLERPPGEKQVTKSGSIQRLKFPFNNDQSCFEKCHFALIRFKFVLANTTIYLPINKVKFVNLHTTVLLLML